MNNTNWMWFATRASGLLSLALLTCVVLLGIATRGGWVTKIWPRSAVTMLHRNLSLLSIVFVAVHVCTTILDGYVNVSWLDVVMPFTAGYRTLWLGLGTVAFDLMIALIATGLLRRRIPARIWRPLHLLSYGVWAFAIIHSGGAGNDRLIVIVSAGLSTALVAGAWLAQSVGTKRPKAATEQFASTSTLRRKILR